MSEISNASFTGTIPEHYDQALGPVIFRDYAEDLARRVAGTPALQVLETAAGTGFVTRRLLPLLAPTAELTVTDLNADMLQVARGKLGSDGRVRILPADATQLPFADAAFDAVVCQFGVMFFPDKDRSYREVRRVLRPGGRYLFNVWDSHDHNAFGRIAYETTARHLPQDPPQFHRVPFGYHRIDPIKESLLEAGFTDIKASVLRHEKRVADPLLFARGLVCGTPVFDQVRARGADPERLAAAIAAAFKAELGLPERLMSMQAIVIEAG